MASFFALVFTCCIRGRPDHSSAIDETSRLIPTTTDPSNAQPRIVVVDHQKLKDRLGNIVRSKEGKMVNVNAQIPFNLHNQALSPRFHPSASRSASLSTNNAHTNDHASTAHRPGTSRPPSPTRSAHTAHSAAPSTTHPRRHSASRSSSAHRGAPPQGADADAHERSPILNVRLVAGAPAGPGEGGAPPLGRRGRRRGRVVAGGPAGRDVRSGDDGPSFLPTLVPDGHPGDGGAVQAAAAGPGTQNASVLTATVEDADSPISPVPVGPADCRGLGMGGDFVICDAGDISRSWGD